MSLVGTRPPTVDEWEQYELHHRSRMMKSLYVKDFESLPVYIRMKLAALNIKRYKEDYIMAELSEAEIVFKIFAEKHK